jgi:hypothetical protein
MKTFVPLWTIACTVIEIACARAGESVRPQIYRCETALGVTYADRPCGVSSQPIVLDAEAINTYHAPSENRVVPQGVKEKPKRARESASVAHEEAKREEQCRKIAASLGDIRERMRTGYTVAAGEKLKEEERKLRARARGRKCG